MNFTVLKEISPSFALAPFLKGDEKGKFKPGRSKAQEITLA